MSTLTEILNTASGIIWGPIMLVLLLGTGVFLTIGLKAMPWRHLGKGFQLLWSGRKSTEEGDINPFQALMTENHLLELIQFLTVLLLILYFQLQLGALLVPQFLP